MQEYCEICGLKTEQNNAFNKWGYQIFKCSSCYSARTIIDKDFKPSDIYTEDYFQGGQKDGYADYKGSEDTLTQEFKKIITRIKKHKSKGKVLEIGSAYGFFLKEANKHFEHSSGIEISKGASDYSTKLGLNIVNDTINESSLEKAGTSDILVLLDVIEHLATPERDFQLLSKNLNPGALVYITTGDFNSINSKVTGKNWRLMTPPQHLFFYSKTGMVKFLKRFGIETESISYEWKFVPLGLIFYQLTQRFGIKINFLYKLNFISIPVNLYDAMTVIGIKK